MSNKMDWMKYFDEKQKKEKDLYKKAGYNSVRSLKLRLNPVSEILDEMDANSFVLDAGCGVGLFLNLLKEKGFGNVIGIDISLNAIKESRKLCKYDLIVGSITELPFKANVFDVILNIEVLMHIMDIQKVFSEFGRVLKCGGSLILITANPDRIFAKSKHPSMILRRKEDIIPILRKEGFSIKKIIDLPIPIRLGAFLFKMVKKLHIPLDLCHSFLIYAIKEK